MKRKPILEIFVPHRSFTENESLLEAYNALKEIIKDKNDLYKHSMEVVLKEFQVDQPNPGDYQTRETLVRDAEKSHAIFILVDGDMSDPIREWYESIMHETHKTRKAHRVRVAVFWNILENDSKDKFNKFCASHGRDYIHSYTSLEGSDGIKGQIDGLKPQLSKELDSLTEKWNSLLNRHKCPPTLKSNRIRRRIRQLLIALILAGAAIAFWYDRSSWLRSDRVSQETEVPTVYEKADKKALHSRIHGVESLMSDGHYAAAHDTLIKLKSTCNPEWKEEIASVDSLLNIISGLLNKMTEDTKNTGKDNKHIGKKEASEVIVNKQINRDSSAVIDAPSSEPESHIEDTPVTIHDTQAKDPILAVGDIFEDQDGKPYQIAILEPSGKSGYIVSLVDGGTTIWLAPEDISRHKPGSGWALPTVQQLKMMYENRDNLGLTGKYWSLESGKRNGTIVVADFSKESFTTIDVKKKDESVLMILVKRFVK